MTTHAEQVLADWSTDIDLVSAARAVGDTAPPLTDEQIARLRTVLADPAATSAA